METIIEDLMADYFKGILQRALRRDTAESRSFPAPLVDSSSGSEYNRGS
jgi:hypothetical protein